MFKVHCDESSISIQYKGKSVLYWDKLEWEEDSALVPQIAEAIRQAYEQPNKLLEFIKQKRLD